MPENNIYPPLSNGDPDPVAETLVLSDMVQTEFETPESQPLTTNGGATIISQSRLNLSSAANHQNQNGNGTTTAAMPRRKVKFLQKLMNFCGDPKRRQQTCSEGNKTITLCFGLSMLGLICSGTVLHIMWFTNLFNDMLIPRLALTENSQSADWWAHPPYHTYLRVHIFNYTNVEEYQMGIDDKLKVEDLGPYTYIEKTEKIDVKYHPNMTITYREKRSYEFDPQNSARPRYEPVIVPNIPVTSALEMVRTSNFFLSLTITQLLTITDAQMFLRLPADSFLWGYEDKFVDMAQLYRPMPFTNFGMLVLKNRTSEDVFRIESGEGHYDKIGQIESLNDKTEMNYWKTDQCNKVEGTDGSQFPPSDIQKGKVVTVYVKDICRKLDLEFEEDVSVFDDLPAKRYRSPMDSFAYPENDTEKQCYCTDGDCPPNGVYDAQVCTSGAPIYVSFPHFYSGDQELIDRFEGIKPIKELHATYADLHPRMGFPMQFASRFQLNVRIPAGSPSRIIKNIPIGEILPILWMEVVPAQFPPEVQNAIYHSSYTTNFVEAVLRYGSVACTSGFAAFILYLLVAMFFVKR